MMDCNYISNPLPFIIESKMRIISYNPQPMIRQLGYDQSANQITWEMGCLDTLTAKSQFVGKGGEHILAKFHSIYWPDETTVGVRSPVGSINWRKFKYMNNFAED